VELFSRGSFDRRSTDASELRVNGMPLDAGNGIQAYKLDDLCCHHLDYAKSAIFGVLGLVT